jgi:hypothetical protein
MNRSEDNTCEYCRGDLPREAIGNVHFCSVECFDASELAAKLQSARGIERFRATADVPLGPVAFTPCALEAGRQEALAVYRDVAQQAADCMGLDGKVELEPVSLLPERP